MLRSVRRRRSHRQHSGPGPQNCGAVCRIRHYLRRSDYGPEERLTAGVPFYAIYGEYDYWPMKLGALEAGEWTGSQGAKQCTWTTDTQTYWAQRLLGKTLDELVATPKVESGITEEQIGSQQAPISLIVNPTEAANRYKNYIWSRDFGGGEVPSLYGASATAGATTWSPVT